MSDQPIPAGLERRIEDERLITGRGKYVDDLRLPASAAFTSGTHVAVVQVDAETGEVSVLRYVAVDDCGRVVNSYLTAAQMHGPVVQGIGQALFEEVLYDSNSQPLSESLMDYALPKASQLPSFALANVETLAPGNPLGAKGAGEAGTIAAPPTIVNAALDALTPFGITEIDMPLRPKNVWAVLRQAT